MICMKSIVIGAVNSTKNLIDVMIRLNMDISMVFSLDDAISENVSAYYPLHEYAEQKGIPYKKYRKINDDENIAIMKKINPDYIFAIGFSQLVSKKILDIPKKCVIGCHPAPLPYYRGRAVVVWQMLNGVTDSKITMFKIDEGADSGDIIAQEPFSIKPEEYAGELLERMDQIQIRLFEKVLPTLIDDTVKYVKQDDSLATYCLKRTPEDGAINWDKSADEIYRLIRAISHPYPGAFGMYDGKHKIVIWRAYLEKNNKYYGFPGQIAEVNENGMIVVLNEGLLVVTEYENVDSVKIFAGHKLR